MLVVIKCTVEVDLWSKVSVLSRGADNKSSPVM